jgi:hypothetical protein
MNGNGRRAILGILGDEVRAVFPLDEAANQAIRDLGGRRRRSYRLWVIPASVLKAAIEALEAAGFVVDVRTVDVPDRTETTEEATA